MTSMSFHIEAPVKKVFEFFRDPANMQSVAPKGVAFEDVVVTKEGLGTSYTWAAKVGGLRLRSLQVYTEFVPDERITERSSLFFTDRFTTSFAPEGTGTKVTMEMHPRSVWGLPPLEYLVRLLMTYGHQQWRGALKTRLESPSVVAA